MVSEQVRAESASIVLEVIDPVTDPRAVDVIERYGAEMRALIGATAGSIHTADLAAYREPEGVFLLACRGREVVGCGALRAITLLDGGHAAEVKRMWVDPSVRGTGTGRAILDRLHEIARERGFTRVVLDSRHELVAAARLYRAAGYEPCAPYNTNADADTWLAREL